MILLGYAATLLMGIILGVVGSGGTILTVPILVYIFGIAPATATGYSLLIVGATAAFGAVGYLRQNLFDLKVASVFAVPSIIAVYLTRLFIMPNIPDVLVLQPVLITKDSAIMVLFAMLMLASALIMLSNRPASMEPDSIPMSSHLHSGKDYLLLVIEGAVIGVLTGMLGAGGGFIIIPALVLILKMPMKQAIGASLYIVALKSLLGFTGDLQAGIELNWQILPFILVTTFLGMALSARIAKKLSGRTLQTYFGLFTLTIASLIIIKELL